MPDRNAVRILLALTGLAACGSSEARAPERDAAQQKPAALIPEARGPHPPNPQGRIPIFEYHVIGAGKTEFHHTPDALRADLKLLYDRGYRPVTVAEMNERRIDQLIPAGYKAFVAVFDDADPSQFRYVEKPNGELAIDPNSAVGIWTTFTKDHPGWRNAATFCVLSAGDAGGSFFGNGNIQGQKTAWRYPKIRHLVDQGFEVCNHTQWHARLDKYPDAFIQEQIAKLALAVDSAVPGYRIKTFALPLGVWPKNRPLAWHGSWRDPKSGRTVTYNYDSVLEVSGGTNVSPYDPKYDPHSINRIIAYKNAVQIILDRLDKGGTAYVSRGSGAPRQAARPPQGH
jgi:hypothetical protein